MVKLRVTARVLPENDYLASLDATTPTTLPIKGEKRFHVVVQEPEKWYIGTLAVAVQQKYQTLYKHDLGQIKYLKDDEDDCDLDPEEGVLDLLVNEGKALTDKSDQHATIKVIREQGRAIRQGSLVPDLTPVHYHLPSKPPVPRFDQFSSTLGKRNADDGGADQHPSKRRKSRLSEIEEEEGGEVIATIEHDSLNNQVVENSQPTQNLHEMVNGFDDSHPNEDPMITTWSFSQLGPPVAVERPTSESTPSRTPGQTLASPSVKEPGSHKRFLKAARDVFAYPESDIDDTELSPDANGVMQITPRLVPSTSKIQQQVRKSPLNSASSTAIASSGEKPAITAFKRKRARASTDDHKVPSSATQSANNVTNASGNVSKVTESASTPKFSTSSQETDAARVHESNTIINEAGRHEQPKVPTSTPLRTVSTLNNVKTREAIADSATQLAKKSQKSETKVRGQRKAVSNQSGNPAMGNSEGSVASGSVPKTQLDNQMTPNRRVTASTMATEQPQEMEQKYRTPSPDSPSEQLSQSLQESARKSMSNKSVSNEDPLDMTPRQQTSKSKESPSKAAEGRLALGITESPRKSQTMKAAGEGKPMPANTTGKKDASTTGSGGGISNDGAKARKRKRRPNKQNDSDSDAGSVHKPAETTTPGSPKIVREVSTESSATKSSAVILPPGMSQAEFDRIIASNAHLNLEPRKTIAKRRSTPSLVTSGSKNSEQENPKVPKKTTEDSTRGTKTPNLAANSRESTAAMAQPEQTPSHTVGRKKSVQALSARTPVSSTKATPVDPAAKSSPSTRPSARVPASTSSKAKSSTPNTLTKVNQLRAGVASSDSSDSESSSEFTSTERPKKVAETEVPPGPNPGSTNSSAIDSTTSKPLEKLSTKTPANQASIKPIGPSKSTPTPKVTTTTAKRPALAGPNSIYQARSLKELAKLSGSTQNSPSTSVVGSPATTTQNRPSFLGKTAINQGMQKKRSLFNNDDDDEDSDDSSQSSSDDQPSLKGAHTSTSRDAITTKSATNQNPPTPNNTAPSARHPNIDDDSGSEETSDDTSVES